jgi:invasion protein IalB
LPPPETNRTKQENTLGNLKMRNTLVGIVLALVLVAGLFAAARFGSRPAESPKPEPSATQTAAQIKSDFIGERTFGDWKLICGPARELPRPPSNGGHLGGNSQGTQPREAPPPPGWKIPRCRATLGLRNAHDPNEQVRLTFRPFGFQRVLALIVRFPPNEVDNGDVVKVRLDQTEWPFPVRSCAAQFCLAIRSLPAAEVAVLENAKRMVLIFKPSSSQKEVAIAVPMTGLVDSLKVMRRIDK